MHSAGVILQKDPARAEILVSEVKSVCDLVLIAQSAHEIQTLASQFPIQIAVVDLGLVSLQEVSRLRGQLGMEIVCTHHTPDEDMWTGALEAGAHDCCFDDDGPAICRGIRQTSTTLNRAAS